MKITVHKSRSIGEGEAPYIISEVGSNWRNLDDCLASIRESKAAGADAVKFQLFTEKELYGFVEPSPFDFYKPYDLNPDWLPTLKAEADKVGLHFMCTAFSPEGYDLVNPYVAIHKVASSEACHLRILQKLEKLGKPVILSTGAKGVEDIKMSLRVLGNTPTILMYCVVAYPARVVDVAVCRALKDQFKTLVGYSDHSTDVVNIPRLAMCAGACVIEKHFTIDRGMGTPDAPHSLDPSEFKLMVDCIRGAPPIKIGPTPEEKTALLRYNRRLIITKDLAIGDELQEGVNFGIYRSLKDDTRGAHPMMADSFRGKRAKVPLKAGQGLWIEDVN